MEKAKQGSGGMPKDLARLNFRNNEDLLDKAGDDARSYYRQKMKASFDKIIRDGNPNATEGQISQKCTSFEDDLIRLIKKYGKRHFERAMSEMLASCVGDKKGYSVNDRTNM